MNLREKIATSLIAVLGAVALASLVVGEIRRQRRVASEREELLQALDHINDINHRSITNLQAMVDMLDGLNQQLRSLTNR